MLESGSLCSPNRAQRPAPHSSRGPGHRPLKAEIIGSNPICGTSFFALSRGRMSIARVQFFSVSLDGFGTGEGITREQPFGHAGERLHEWMFATRSWHERVGEPGGS